MSLILRYLLGDKTKNPVRTFDIDLMVKTNVYPLALMKASKKWTMPIRNWNTAINRFAIVYEERLPI